MKNVVHIVIDALRFDCLDELINQNDKLVPNFAWLRENSICFNNYFANGAPTEMALASIFSSTLPLDYGGYAKGMRNRPKYLQEVLRDMGYRTEGMFVGRPVCNFPKGYNHLRSVVSPYNFIKTLLYKTGRKLMLIESFNEKIIDDYTIEIFDEIIEDIAKNNESFKARRIVRNYHKNKRHFIIFNSIKHCGMGVINLLQEKLRCGKTYYVSLINEYMSFDPARKIEIINDKFGILGNDTYCSGERLLKRYLPKLKLNIENYYLYIQLMDVHEKRFLSYDCDEELVNSEYEIGEDIINKAISQGATRGDAEYIASIAYEDKIIGRIFQQLRECKLMDNTIIVVSADHGAVGFNNRIDSHVAKDFFDELYHIPLFIFDGKNAYKDNRLLSAIDFAPTLVSILKIKLPRSFKGTSFSDKDFNNEKNEFIIMEHTGRGKCDPYKKVVTVCVRTKLWKVVYKDKLFRYYSGKKVFELYNLKRDPDEGENLAENTYALEETSELISIAQHRMKELREYYEKNRRT